MPDAKRPREAKARALTKMKLADDEDGDDETDVADRMSHAFWRKIYGSIMAAVDGVRKDGRESADALTKDGRENAATIAKELRGIRDVLAEELQANRREMARAVSTGARMIASVFLDFQEGRQWDDAGAECGRDEVEKEDRTETDAEGADDMTGRIWMWRVRWRLAV